MDRGAAQVGEFSLTDRRFSRINRFMANTLFDENFGGAHGNSHIALGASYRNTFAGDPRRLIRGPQSEAGVQRLGPALGFREHGAQTGDGRAGRRIAGDGL